MSKSKGRKEKEKIKKQAKGKKQVAGAKQTVNMPLTNQTMLDGMQDLGVKKRVRH